MFLLLMILSRDLYFLNMLVWRLYNKFRGGSLSRPLDIMTSPVSTKLCF